MISLNLFRNRRSSEERVRSRRVEDVRTECDKSVAVVAVVDGLRFAVDAQRVQVPVATRNVRPKVVWQFDACVVKRIVAWQSRHIGVRVAEQFHYNRRSPLVVDGVHQSLCHVDCTIRHRFNSTQ